MVTLKSHHNVNCIVSIIFIGAAEDVCLFLTQQLPHSVDGINYAASESARCKSILIALPHNTLYNLFFLTSDNLAQTYI